MNTKFKVGDRVRMHPTPSTSENPGVGFVPNAEMTISHIKKIAGFRIMFFEESCNLGVYEGNFSLIVKEDEEIWY